jgi:hypothetical protein
MGTAWIGFVGALVGGMVVAISSFINARYEFRWNTGWERRTVLRSKLEELFAAVSDYREACAETYAYLVARRPGQMIEAPETAPLTRLKVLVRFYAPELRTLLEHLEAAQETLGVVLLDLVVHQEEKDPRAWADGIGRLGRVVATIDDVCERMEEAVVRRSHRSALHLA